MKTIFLILVCCGFCPYSSHAATGDSYRVNVTADAMSLSPATNELGEITFLNTGDGNEYRFRVRSPNNSITEGKFYVGSIAYIDWVTVEREINTSHHIGYGNYGSPTGTIKIVRQAGSKFGTYSISNTPIGTVSGQFAIVRFSGIIQAALYGEFKGQLQGQANLFGAPELLGLGPSDTAADDFVGDETGRDYSVSLSPDNTLIIADGSTANAGKAWRWFRGTYSDIQSDQLQQLQITIETSAGVGSAWTLLTTIPAPIDADKRIYRLAIRKSH